MLAIMKLITMTTSFIMNDDHDDDDDVKRRFLIAEADDIYVDYSDDYNDTDHDVN